MRCVRIYYDSQSVTNLENPQMYHESTNHIDIHFYFVIDMIDQKILWFKKLIRKTIWRMCSPSHYQD